MHCMNALAKTQSILGPWTGAFSPWDTCWVPATMSPSLLPGYVLGLCSSGSSHCEQASHPVTACPTPPSPAWEETRLKGRLSSLVSSRAGMAPAFVQVPSLLP